jgi:hypothetical protein
VAYLADGLEKVYTYKGLLSSVSATVRIRARFALPSNHDSRSSCKVAGLRSFIFSPNILAHYASLYRHAAGNQRNRA